MYERLDEKRDVVTGMRYRRGDGSVHINGVLKDEERDIYDCNLGRWEGQWDLEFSLSVESRYIGI